jgi:hypothetical protein
MVLFGRWTGWPGDSSISGGIADRGRTTPHGRQLEASLAANETRRHLFEARLAEALAPDEARDLEAAE